MSNPRKRRRGEKRVYGFFHCDECNRDWESAHVYVSYDTEEVLYQQECKNCETAYYPDFVAPIRCSDCEEVDCICSDDEWDVDFSGYHLEEYCHRCRSGRKCVSKRYR